MAKKEVKKKTKPEVKSKGKKEKNVPAKAMKAKDYRMKAASIVKPMSGDFAVVFLVYAVIMGAITGALSAASFIPGNIGMTISSTLIGLFTLLTSGAIIFSFINLSKEARKGTKPKVGGIFYGFKERYSQSLGVYIMTTIFTVLWTLLLIVPGIIKSFAYSMSQYVAFDNPDKSPLDCITESRRLMYGNKWKLFCLGISYIGWFLLMILTLGILSLWVMPKFRQAIYEFYLNVAHKK